MGSISKAWVLVYSVVMIGVALAGLLMAGGPTGVDRAVMTEVEGMRSDGVTSVVSVLSELFSPALVPVWAVIIAGYLLFRDRRVHRAAALLASVVAAAAVAEVVKVIVSRPRPPAPDQVSGYEATLSYPSGHVTGTAALLVAVALLGTVAFGRAARNAALVAALAVTAFVAWTRLYLGVHWLTDVAAGLLVGASTAVLAVAVMPVVTTLIADRLGDRLPPGAAQWFTRPRAAGRHALAETVR